MQDPCGRLPAPDSYAGSAAPSITGVGGQPPPIFTRAGRHPQGHRRLLCPVKDFFGFGEELGDLFGEVLGAGARQADGGDDASVVSAEPDEPGSPGWSAPGARGAGVDLDGDGWHAWSLSGRGRGCCWPGCRGCGQDREGPLQGEGKLLLGHAGSWQAGEAGDGRRIVRRPAGAAADLRVRPSPGGGR